MVLVCLCLFGGFFFVLCSDLLFSFPRDFLLPPRSGVLRGSCLLLFFFEVFLSAFEVSFSSRHFLFFGGEVWPGPFVFGPALGSVDSSLGSGKICASVFAGAVSCSASFFFFLSLCMWFRQNLGVSSLRRSLWWSAGCSDPGTFCWCCGILSLPCRSLWALGRGFLFCLLSSVCGFLFTAFSRQLAAIGVLFVVFLLLLPERFGSVLQFLAAFFLFSCECILGAWWCYPWGPLRVLIHLLRLFCSFLSTFVFSSFLCLTFPMAAESHFSVGLILRAAVFSFACLSCSRSFCLSYPEIHFLFQGA